MFRLLAIFAVLASTSATAGELVFPVDCTLGDTCFIQNYVDRAPGRGAVDFTCGPLSYDGHKGTDIRVRDYAAMQEGVSVFSATPGTVTGMRDGMDDHPPDARDVLKAEGRECGNGVVVTRNDGWQFQYCHLRKGSVTVKRGQEISTGDPLGQIGQSGVSQFPHLHLSIRDQAGRVIDPFDSRQQNESCSLKDRRTLWRDVSPKDYQPGGALNAGITDRIPKYNEVLAGTAMAELSPISPGMVFWALFFGVRKDDVIELALEDPNGETIARDTVTMNRNRAQQYRAVGRKSRSTWQAGTYIGTAELTRNRMLVDRITAEIVLK